MAIKNIFIIRLLFILCSTGMLNANISGIVFQDIPVNNQNLNTYGVKDTNELGVQGILVTAYPDNISTTTDNNGAWILNTTQDSRIEFSTIPTYLKESVTATIKNTSVQFITNNTNNVTFGLHNPADFSETVNPYYVSNLQQNGTHNPSTIQNLQTVHYNASELNADFKSNTNIQGTGEIPQDAILMNQLGSIWGKAYQKNKKRLFSASMLQRHIGFAITPADVYVTDYSTGIPASLLGNFSLQGKSPSNGGTNIDLGTVDRSAASGTDYTLTSDPLLQNIDLDAYAKVGKISYGGIDIDHNTNTLWLINLNQKGIISVDISGDFSTLSTSATIKQYLIQNLANLPTCTNGELRPWALKIHKDRGYVGAVCDGSSSQFSRDLSAHILSFDLSNPALGFVRELDFSLNYARQLRPWYPWEDAYFDPTPPKAYNGRIYGQPILSDIEFDKEDNMYLAFFDRYSTQLGSGNYKAISGTTATENSYEYGEILKICNTNGTYEKEGTGSCLQTNYTDLGISEFFNDQGGDRNRESSLGALAILKGSNQLLLTTTDPHPESTSGTTNPLYWATQGTHTLSLSDGSIENWYSFALTSIKGLNSKANGLGDIELITEAAPFEIGNRIWRDVNGDGIQNVNENGMGNVTINLICNGTIQSTATTNATGNYIFSNDTSSAVTSTASHRYNVSNLIENTNNCYLSIPNISGVNQQASLNNYVLTIANLGEGNNSNLNDSNAEVNGTNAKITINALEIPISGANNHNFDIGFKLSTNLTLGNRLWIDSDRDGIQDSNELGYAGTATVSLYNNGNCSGAPVITTTTNNGIYHFTGLTTGTYCVAFTQLPTNHTISPRNRGTNDALDSDAKANAQIRNIQLTTDSLDQDIGIYPTPIVAPAPVVAVGGSNNFTLGNRVWIDTNRDGIQDNNESGYVGATVRLYNSSNCAGTAIATTTTRNNGLYEFTGLSSGNYCIQFTNIPDNYNISSINQGGDNTLDSDANSNAQIENIQLTATSFDEDMGIYPASVVLGTTVCQDMLIEDDIQNANPSNATTVIDVLNNDTGTKSGQRIKFLSIADGKALWESQDTNITSIATFDTLVVEGEGTWSVIDNKVSFTALNSFDGQIPTPVYYIIEGTDCTATTRYTNVGRISINTACTCPTYSTKSVASFNNITILLLLLLTIGITFSSLRREVR